MANIDQLSIEINADANKATQAISNLTSSLQELSRSLSSLKTDSISKFARSMESLSKTGRATDAATSAIENMAKALSASFGIKSKEGIEAVRNGMLDLAEASKRFRQNGMTNELAESVGEAEKNVANLVQQYAKIEKQLDGDTKAVVDFVNGTRQGSVAIGAFAKEFGDDFAQMKRNLGKGFTAELDSTKKGLRDFEDYIKSIKEETKVSMFDNLAPDKAFEKLSNIMAEAKNSTMSYSDAVQDGAINLRDALDSVISYSASIEHLVTTQDRLTKENGIDALVSSLRGLSDVSVPDFTSFAHAIETLNRVNVDRVTRNLERVKETLAQGTQRASDMVTALVPIQSFSFDNFGNVTSFTMGVSNFVHEIEEKMLPALYQSGEIVVSLTNSFQPLAPIISTANEVVVVMNGSLERAGYYIEDMKNKMAQFIGMIGGESTSVPLLEDFRTYKPDIIDTVEIIQQGMNAEPIQEVSEAVSEMADNFANARVEIEGQSRSIGNMGSFLSGVMEKCKHLSTVLLATSEMIKKLSDAFQKLADIGVSAIKTLLSSFNGLKSFAQYLVSDFQEKTEGIKNTFTNMANSLQNQMSRISAFWQRTLRTFTFMLVRKAITAVIKDIKSAIDELVLFEKHLGNLSSGAFNNSVSEIIADFHLIGRAITAAFEPLINWVVPILNAVANQVANMLATVGEFFAAFTGQSYFVKAKKTVVDYASTLEDTAEEEQKAADDNDDNNNNDNKKLKEKVQKLKEIKKLLLGIDELNLLPKQDDDDDDADDDLDDTIKKVKDTADKIGKQKTPKGGGIDYKNAYEEIPVSSEMLDFVNKIKDILSDLFEPLKKAWDKVFPYLKMAWEYMGKELLALAKSIGEAFMEVWKQPKTQEIFENLLRIIGDLMIVVGNLAKRFREAWDSITNNGKKLGVEIFEHLRDIIWVLVDHVRNVTKYMIKWSDEIDFKPLLNGINDVLAALYPVADFLGGVFEDVMKNIVLEHIRYLIEEGIPHLCAAIKEVTEAFDWEKLRSQLEPVEKAFEKMTQQIHEGLINAMKNLGIELGKWTQTENFQKFLDGIVYFMNQVTAERVEKLFTGLGLGILKIVEGLAKFVGSEEFKKFCDDFFAWYDSLSAEDIAKFFYGIAEGIGKLALGIAKFVFSDEFQNFLKKITEWYRNLSADDIANGLIKIGKAIATFTFASFIGTGVATFLSFMGKIITFTQLSQIASGMSALAGGTAEVGAAAGGAAGGLSGFVSALGAIAAPVAIAVALITSLVSSYGGLQGTLEKIKSVFDEVGKYAKSMADALQIDKNILNLEKAFKNLYDALGKLKPLWDAFFVGLQAVVTFIVGSVIVAFQAVINIIAGVADAVSGVINIVAGFIEILTGLFTDNKETFKQGVEDFAMGIYEVFSGVIELVAGVLEFFGAPIIGIITSFCPDTITAIEEWVNSIIDFFKNLKYELIGDPIVVDMVEGILGLFEQLVTDGLQWITELVTGVLTFFEQLYTEGTQWISDTVIGIIGFFEQLYNDGSLWISDFVTNALTFFEQFGMDAGLKIEEFVTNAATKFQEFKDGAETKFNEFKEGAATIFGEVKSDVVEKATQLKDGAIEKYEKLKSDALTKWEEMKKGASEKFNDAKKKAVDSANEMKKNVTDKINDMVKKSKEKFGELPKNISEKFNDMKSKAKDKMTQTVDMVKEKLDKMKEKFEKLDLTKMGENTIRGFFNGVKTVWAQVVSWASQKLAEFKSKFAEILQIHSPSRVFMKYGEYTVEGFNIGLQKYSEKTGKVVEQWVDSFSGMSVTLEPDIDMNMSRIPLVNEQKFESSGLTKEELVEVLNDFANVIRTRNANNETRVVLEMDGRELYETVVRQDKQQMLRTGISSFAY